MVRLDLGLSQVEIQIAKLAKNIEELVIPKGSQIQVYYTTCHTKENLVVECQMGRGGIPTNPPIVIFPNRKKGGIMQSNVETKFPKNATFLDPCIN